MTLIPNVGTRVDTSFQWLLCDKRHAGQIHVSMTLDMEAYRAGLFSLTTPVTQKSLLPDSKLVVKMYFPVLLLTLMIGLCNTFRAG